MRSLIRFSSLVTRQRLPECSAKFLRTVAEKLVQYRYQPARFSLGGARSWPKGWGLSIFEQSSLTPGLAVWYDLHRLKARHAAGVCAVCGQALTDLKKLELLQIVENDGRATAVFYNLQ